MKNRFLVRNETDAAEMRISGVIDRYWDRDTYSASDTEQDVLNELSQIPKGRKINVRVNSEGGSVKLSLGIHNALKTRASDVTVFNDGIMLSSATILPPKGSRVICPLASVYMIHKPAADFENANSKDLQKAIEMLDAHESAMASVYCDRTGKSEKKIREMMDTETWLNGDQAVKQGFANDNGSDLQDPKARFEISAHIFSAVNIPEEFKSRFAVVANEGHTSKTEDRPVTAPAATLNGGKSAETNQPKSMNKIIAALAVAGIAVPADANEDQLVVNINSLVKQSKDASAKITELETSNTDLTAKAEQARKERIEAHVQSKVDAKIIAADLKEKWVAGILKDESAQALLDAMPAPTAAKPARGAAAPPAESGDAGKTDADKLTALREKLNPKSAEYEVNSEKRAEIAIQCRELRGHKDMFAPHPLAKN